MNTLRAFSFSKKTRFLTEYLAIPNIAVSEEKSAAATFFKKLCSLKSTIFLPDWQNLTFKLCWVIGNILFYAYKAQILIFEGFDFAIRTWKVLKIMSEMVQMGNITQLSVYNLVSYDLL